MATVSFPLLWVASLAGVQSAALAVVAVELVSFLLLPHAAISSVEGDGQHDAGGKLQRREHPRTLPPERLPTQ